MPRSGRPPADARRRGDVREAGTESHEWVPGYRRRGVDALQAGRLFRRGTLAFPVGPRTVLVQFRFVTCLPGPGGLQYRVGKVVMQLRSGVGEGQRDLIARQVGEMVQGHYAEFQMAMRVTGSHFFGQPLEMAPDGGVMRPVIDVLEVRHLLGDSDLRLALGFGDGGHSEYQSMRGGSLCLGSVASAIWWKGWTCRRWGIC